eukprot:jgi/Bigna1/127492/aug1.4_g2200
MPGSISLKEEAQLDGLGSETQSPHNKISSSITKDKTGIVSCHASLSRVGYIPFNSRKVNQDRCTENLNFAKDPKKCLFGVFDGHGQVGHDVSQFLIDNLPGMIAAKGVPQLEKNPHKEITTCFEAANVKLNKSGIDTTCSGTTAVVCYIDDHKIYTCNSGDSRAVIGTMVDGKLIGKGLSKDQKPEVESEAKRIIDNNGRVQACQDMDGNPVGPMRVWLKYQDIPGLAMTRSFGDKLAASVGVICTPEILEYDIKEGVDQFIIIGSDGIWEFIDNQTAVDIVAKQSNPQKAVKAIVEEATSRWQMVLSGIKRKREERIEEEDEEEEEENVNLGRGRFF